MIMILGEDRRSIGLANAERVEHLTCQTPHNLSSLLFSPIPSNSTSSTSTSPMAVAATKALLWSSPTPSSFSTPSRTIVRAAGRTAVALPEFRRLTSERTIKAPWRDGEKLFHDMSRRKGNSKVSRGGAFVVRMNLFDRFARVVKSYANAVLSTFEDPEKILEQAVLEMNDDMVKMRQATAQVLASQKRLENRYKAAQEASDEWYRRAQLALGKGDENLAREALQRRKSYADNANSLKSQLEQQKTVAENLVSNMKVLESKIQEAKAKKDTLKARAQSAKTATKVSELMGNVNTTSALSAFEKMEEKVLAMESQAEALNQLTTDDLEGKFALLETSSVDDDLASLKRELSGSSLKGELPEGRTSSSSKTELPFRDLEVERELNELRRKTKEY